MKKCAFIAFVFSSLETESLFLLKLSLQFPKIYFASVSRLLCAECVAQCTELARLGSWKPWPHLALTVIFSLASHRC